MVYSPLTPVWSPLIFDQPIIDWCIVDQICAITHCQNIKTLFIVFFLQYDEEYFPKSAPCVSGLQVWYGSMQTPVEYDKMALALSPTDMGPLYRKICLFFKTKCMNLNLSNQKTLHVVFVQRRNKLPGVNYCVRSISYVLVAESRVNTTIRIIRSRRNYST